MEVGQNVLFLVQRKWFFSHHNPRRENKNLFMQKLVAVAITRVPSWKEEEEEEEERSGITNRKWF